MKSVRNYRSIMYDPGCVVLLTISIVITVFIPVYSVTANLYNNIMVLELDCFFFLVIQTKANHLPSSWHSKLSKHLQFSIFLLLFNSSSSSKEKQQIVIC